MLPALHQSQEPGARRTTAPLPHGLTALYDFDFLSTSLNIQNELTISGIKAIIGFVIVHKKTIKTWMCKGF